MCLLVLALGPAFAAEVPSEMLGAWCLLDWRTTQTLVPKGEWASYYSRIKRFEGPDSYHDCGHWGGMEITKDGLTLFRFRATWTCKFEETERVGPTTYRTIESCERVNGGDDRDRNHHEYEIAPLPPSAPPDWEPRDRLMVRRLLEG